MVVADSEIRKFRDRIFTWWRTHRRDLPWRNTSDPYRILISEVMLQQTQVARVLPAYGKFLREFPTVADLADAPVSKVLIAWKGMGYNRRALYLKKTAQEIVRTYNGKFPQTERELLQLPGIGKYTARAVLVFAFRKHTAMVDTNIRQIIRHYFFGGAEQKESVIERVAEDLVPAGREWEWHQALMDYGALQMKQEKIGIARPNQGKKSVAFKDSARFIRGRIIDVLRETPLPYTGLIGEVISRIGRSDDRIHEEIQRLSSEGLIEILPNGMVRLAQ